jgi:hypothetical protein
VDTAPEEKPDWMEENDVAEVTRGNVAKQGLEHIDR